MHELTPEQIVAELDRHIIGQNDAKRAVAVAVRNRWRRQQLDPELAREVAPRNIIMVGPTGVGKTEIARRLSRLVRAPFIKVEATKYTEVGYHGRDVESMVRDLLDLAVNMLRAEQAESVAARADELVENRILDILMGDSAPRKPAGYVPAEASELGGSETSAVREKMRQKLRDGLFEDREIEVSVREKQNMPVIAGMGADQMDPAMTSLLEQIMPARSRTRRVKISEARSLLREEETEKLLDNEKIIEEAIARTEQSGIIFLDEIDKIASSSEHHGSADISRQGVQRDLLPIVEGSAVTTRHGLVHTDHILFVAAGAFHSSSVSDLMPELQGRFPIRVELTSLTRDDFVRILRDPEHSLLKQQQALLATEGLDIHFDDDAVDALADTAARANSMMENIGARRLMTIVERLFEEISFNAPALAADPQKKSVRVTAEMVRTRLEPLLKDEDLGRFVL